MEGWRKAIPGWEPGTLFAERYRIVSQIGTGGMGKVYLAEDCRLNGKKRALKMTASTDAQGDGEEFIREAKLMTGLQHPHLPDILDYYPPDRDGWAVIVMEYVAGDSLADLFKRNGNRMPFGRALHYLLQLCDLLCYLHSRNPQIVFRDLKPANVLIDSHDRAILVDFGIARTYRPDAAADTERLGTPAFASPEQWKGGQTDARSDLYGWGALAYFLLSHGNFAMRRTGGLRHELQSDVPAPFCELLDSLLSEDPQQRPQNAHELRQLLVRHAGTAAEQTEIPGRENAFFPNGRPDGVTVAAILSAYPGAGATFATLGLSRYLSSQAIEHAVVECPGGDSEWFALLDGRARMPKSAVYADPSGQGETAPAWREKRAAYYPLPPDAVFAGPQPAFSGWIRRLGAPLVLLDVSAKWELPGMDEWLAGSRIDSLWWVADCLPAKWSSRRRAAAAALHAKTVACGTSGGWIANRDCAFPQREEWLACFPEVPVARLPLLPAELLIRSVWSGTDRPFGKGASDRAFQKWVKAVIVSQGS